MKEFLSSFEWHSSVGLDTDLADSEELTISKLANNDFNRAKFLNAGENLLIHKSSQALWKLSEDKKSIEPVFDSDILNENDLQGE